MVTATAKQIDVTMTRVKETKNTIRFEAEDEAVDTLYVQKSALAEIGNPETITVTIAAA